MALSAFDGLATGLGFTLALTLMGAVREVTGAGTLFAGASLLLGPQFAFLETKVADAGALFMILPPGGFLVLGLLIAARLVCSTGRNRGSRLACRRRLRNEDSMRTTR